MRTRRELLSCVKRQREDHGVVRRANALLLLDDGKSCVDIAQVRYLDDDTVRGWHTEVVLVFRPVCSHVKVDQGFILGC